MHDFGRTNEETFQNFWKTYQKLILLFPPSLLLEEREIEATTDILST